VTLEVRMILPRWEPPAKTAPGLTATWDEYLAALREHEDGHYRIALRAADEVRAVLGSGSVARECPLLEKQLNSAANDVLDRTRQRQADYDRDTDSGRAQGTRVL
jgi:predicted secreted Zn-dependent protease